MKQRVVLIGGVAAAVLLALFGAMMLRVLSLPVPETVAATGEVVALDDNAMAARLGRAIQIPTISTLPPGDPQNDLSALHALLRECFPRAHSDLKLEPVGEHSLLYFWEGTDPTLPPLVLMSHQDVVPIAPGTESSWEVPPFSGRVEGGFIWGRGTLDDKVGVLGILEAVEWLRSQNFRPKRSVYLAFGHDEEVGGLDGAVKIAALLEARGVKPLFVLDEGGLVAVDGLVPGVAVPAALVAVAEKGYLTLRLSVKGEPGHSSMPPRRTLIGRLSKAVARLEDHPLPLSVTGPSRDMLIALAPVMPFPQRLAVANLWIFERLVLHLMGKADSARAALGTTTAPTVFRAGNKDNVLPGNAEAIINFRILPGETVASVTTHVREVIKDPDIAIEEDGKPQEPSSVSDAHSPVYAGVARAIQRGFPGTPVAPFLTTGATDAFHFQRLTPNVFRFLPLPFAPSDMTRFHGTNERVSIKAYGDAVRFYIGLLQSNAS